MIFPEKASDYGERREEKIEVREAGESNTGFKVKINSNWREGSAFEESELSGRKRSQFKICFFLKSKLRKEFLCKRKIFWFNENIKITVET